MASARTLKRRAQRLARKRPRGGGSPSILDRIAKAFYADSPGMEEVLAQSVLYDKIARRASLDVDGRAYTYSIYTNYNAHQELDLPDSP